MHMKESDFFRASLEQLRRQRGLSAAGLSRLAGLNPRAVTDIEEGRADSPKLSTAFALARALGADPAEMMGLGPRVDLVPELAAYLAQYDESEQEQLLRALSALPGQRP